MILNGKFPIEESTPLKKFDDGFEKNAINAAFMQKDYKNKLIELIKSHTPLN